MKQQALRLLRRAHLLEFADGARRRWLSLRQRSSRDAFSQAHGGAALPPDDLAYDAYGGLDWNFYWGFGQLIAGAIGERIRQHSAAGRVLEWGCGPARIVRHLPEVLGAGFEIHATDANARTIEWCAAHVPGVRFAVNGTAPPLPFDSEQFTCVYSVSVFTHLPAALHAAWAADLYRVLAPGGILICTLNGEASREMLLPEERASFDQGRLVVRDGVASGTRCFVACHPPSYVAGKLFSAFEILRHEPAPNVFGGRQDIWMARRPG